MNWGINMIGSHRTDARVRRVLDELEYHYKIDDDGDFKLTMNLGDGRSQNGFINSNTSSFAGLEIREIYSIAYIIEGTPTEKIANFLLRDNGRVKLGAWRISGDSGGGRCALVFAAHIAADSDARTFNAVLVYVLRKADEFEREAFETDKF